MRVRKVDPSNIDAAAIAEAATIITRGGLVAFPTETVYGLGADATNAAAVEAIFTAKGRPSYNPLIVHAADVIGATRCVTSWPDSARTLASQFWPGPLTIVLRKHAMIPDIVTAGLPTVGVRVPSHPVAQSLIRAAGVPIAAPSANRSTQVSPTSGDHVVSVLGGGAELVLDAGPATVGIESTVIDLSLDVPTVLRPGMITVEELRASIGRVELVTSAVEGAARPSPGMMDRHYSPRARLRIVKTLRDLSPALADASARGSKVVVLAHSPMSQPTFTLWPMPGTPAEYARELYATLHRADSHGFDEIIVEGVPRGTVWDGVRDRLRRAAT